MKRMISTSDKNCALVLYATTLGISFCAVALSLPNRILTIPTMIQGCIAIGLLIVLILLFCMCVMLVSLRQKYVYFLPAAGSLLGIIYILVQFSY
jgi:hypothetical protein